MIRYGLLFIVVCSVGYVHGQVVNTATMDTLETTKIGHVGLGGYVDTYYGYNFNQPSSGYNPYFVSSARHNELSVNLAYVDVRYRSQYMRVRFVPGFGTYMDANYAHEPGSLKNMVEANIGLLLFEKKKIWIDAGVLGSPYTNESAISKDHLMYTRSFAPENVPYYITGIKLTVPLSEKVNAYAYLINGWQVIQDNNTAKSVGTQLEFRPNKTMLLNWNTYTGDERSADHPDYRLRFFNDFYWIWNSGNRWSATSCFYYGVQQRSTSPTAAWWQVNFIARYAFTNIVSLSARIEHFDDPSGIIVHTVTGATRFRTTSYGLCANVQFHKMALFRLEYRQFTSLDNVYQDKNSNPTGSSALLVGSLTAWF